MTVNQDQAPAGHNSGKRHPDVIGTELRKRRDIFDSGALLVEAKEACARGEWLPWLESYFDASEDTAERHMAAYRLSFKFRAVRNLKVPPTIVYELDDIDDEDLPAVIEALDKAVRESSKPLNVSDANEVIEHAQLKIRHGDFPPATLRELDCLDENTEWEAIYRSDWIRVNW